MIDEAQVRAALRYVQDLPYDFPNFVVENPGYPMSQKVYDDVDAENMRTMRAILEVAEAAQETRTTHIIQEEP